jgi:hypothetical protein
MLLENLYAKSIKTKSISRALLFSIKRQRMRERGGRLFKQGLQQVHQEFQNTLQETNPDSGFTKRENRNRELEVNRSSF